MTLSALRTLLETELAEIRDAAAFIKSDEVVDDEACDKIAASTRNIASGFNKYLKALGLATIDVPPAIAASPYQKENAG